MNAYLQRADDFIQQQIYKLEQKKQGREYLEMNRRNSRQQYPQPQRPQTFSQPPPPPAPQGWAQEFDPNTQRWYYLNRATGRAQWNPPSHDIDRSGHRHTVSHSGLQYANTFNDEDLARRVQEEEMNRGRTSLQQPRPGSGHLGVPQQQQKPGSVSPHPSPMGRLPPGAHFDMRTGQIVYNIYPRDHPMNAQY